MSDWYWKKNFNGKYVKKYGDWYWKKQLGKYIQVSGKSKWMKLSSIHGGKYIQVPI